MGRNHQLLFSLIFHVSAFCRSDTYSSNGVNEGTPYLAEPLNSLQEDFSGVGGSHTGRTRQGGHAVSTMGEMRASDSTGVLDFTEHQGEGSARSSRQGSLKGSGEAEDGNIPKTNWNRTLDTAVSIPEGSEERADEHEANASID